MVSIHRPQGLFHPRALPLRHSRLIGKLANLKFIMDGLKNEHWANKGINFENLFKVAA